MQVKDMPIKPGCLSDLEILELCGQVIWEELTQRELPKRIDWFCLVWFLCFNGISTLFRLFNAKSILLEEQLCYYLTHSWEDKGVHTFPQSICLKVNVIARLEYEHAFYDSAVHHFNHYTTRTTPKTNWSTTYWKPKYH